MQELKLTRPLIDIDFETTGTNPATCRVVSVAATKTMPDGTIDVRSMIIDPCCDIPTAASDVHKITNEVLAEMKLKGKVYTFADIAKSMYAFVDGCDFRGYGIIDFDIPVLAEEFARAGIDFWGNGEQFPKPGTLYFDGMVIFKKMEERTLTAALQFYCGIHLTEAHEAMADLMASKQVFLAQIKHYEGLDEMPLEDLAAFCKRDNRVDLSGFFIRKDDNRVYFAFGKHKDKKVADVFMTDHSYYNWMIEEGAFTSDTKRHARTMYAMIHNPQQVS